MFFAMILATSTAAFAGASGVEFTPDEFNAHLLNARTITDTAAACLQQTWAVHNAFYKQNGYSKFYGSRRQDYKTAEDRRSALLRILPDLAKRVRKGDPAAMQELTRREAELETTSCVGLALKCLGQGFAAAGMQSTWDKIYTWVGRSGEDGTPLFYGTDLQKALVDLGWKSLYWNPDVSQNEEWDSLEQEFNPLKEGKEWNPVWGGHTLRWASVLRKRLYYGIPVHDIQTLVNFGINPPSDFQTVPFFVGTAHSGYHVFPGFRGQVIEAHSMRELKSRSNMEVGPFNPLYQGVNGVENGNGSPRWTRSEHYRSGVIVVPPGVIADKPYSVPPAAVNVPPNGTIPPDRSREEDRPRRRNDCFWVFCR